MAFPESSPIKLRLIEFKKRSDAEDVIGALKGQIEVYGFVTVEDYYHLVGEVGTYIDSKWGWSDLSRVSAVRVRPGYILSLPNPNPVLY